MMVGPLLTESDYQFDSIATDPESGRDAGFRSLLTRGDLASYLRGIASNLEENPNFELTSIDWTINATVPFSVSVTARRAA